MQTHPNKVSSSPMDNITNILTISLGQINVRWGDPDSNMTRMRECIEEAARRGSDVLVMPELWDTGYALDRAQDLATMNGEGRFAEVAALAQEHGIHVVGSMLELGYQQGTSRPSYNTAAWFSPEGAVAGIYRKIHLFRPFQEDQYLLPGGAPHWLELPWGLTALAICYDLRFPELFRSYRQAGVNIVFIPAEWPLRRLAHWQTLLRARAIENQTVIVACNSAGDSNGNEMAGHSAIYDAWGETVVEGGTHEDIITATVDLSHVAEIRQNFPIFEDRRPDVYDCI